MRKIGCYAEYRGHRITCLSSKLRYLNYEGKRPKVLSCEGVYLFRQRVGMKLDREYHEKEGPNDQTRSSLCAQHGSRPPGLST